MWIQTGVTVRKRLSWVVTSVTLTFDLWPWPFAWTSHLSLVTTSENFMMIRWWEHSQKGVMDRQTDGQTDRQTENTIHRAAWSQLKTIGHLFYATSSFVHHFIAINEFKLELQSGNAQFGSNLKIFWAVWTWNLIDELEQGKSERFDSCDRPSNLTQIGFKSLIFRPCDLEILWMTPKNNKARLLYNIKLCVSFHIHQWIQTGVTVRKHPIWVKLDNSLSCVTLQFDVWPWKTIGHLFYATSSFVHHFVAIGELKLELQSGNTQFGSNSTIFRAVWPCDLTYDLEKQ